MAEITASLVKELRDRTGLGMMECKKALTEANGDIETAIDNLRKSGQAKAAKKAGNIAAEGAIIVAQEGNTAIILEVNSQTDFVARDANFSAFANKVAGIALAARETDVAKIAGLAYDGQTVEEARIALVQKIGENIQVRRAQLIEGALLGSYIALILWIAGMKYSDQVGVAAILNQSSTIYILLLANLFLKEPFTLRKAAATGAALSGIVIVTVF